MSAAAHSRTLIGPLFRRAYRLRVAGEHHVPRRGGLLVVANHPGALDGVVLATGCPRPVRVLGDRMRIPGSLPLPAGEPAGPALRAAVGVLRAGEAVAVFPEGELGSGAVEAATPAAAYCQVAAGVPVLPVALVGTHGTRPTDPPRPRSVIDVVFGEPFTPEPPADPLSRAAVLGVAEEIRQRLADHVAMAGIRTRGSDIGSERRSNSGG